MAGCLAGQAVRRAVRLKNVHVIFKHKCGLCYC